MTLHLTSEDVNMPTSIKISNSGVSTWLVCEKQYYYKYDLGMEPLHKSETINRGSLGHEVLAIYYQSRKDGISHDNSVAAARQYLSTLMTPGHDYDFGVILDVDRILTSYWPIAAMDKWEILQVETAFDVFLSDEFEFTMRLDLLIRDLTDGKIKVVDHKFVYNFKTEAEIELDPQMPKYVGALRANGINVDSAMFNQIRYRKLKDPTTESLFQRREFKPSNNKIVNIIRDQITASQEIVQWKALPLEVRAKKSKRILNQMVCKMCGVRSLCAAELDGAPIEYLAATEYKMKEHNSSEPSTAELESLI